ncbi:hypothetical protein U9R90_29325 [Streptomyces sp. E11-3]|uniref:DUF6851 domain-containing protein n=1 Tax=Streptomyces sp. E11-3 TaxID=3110112 RepID=UPI00397FC8E4
MREAAERRGRLRRKVALGCAMTLALTGTGYAMAESRDGTTAQADAAKADFDFDKGNSALEVIYPVVGPMVREHINQIAMDGTLVLRVSALMESAWFDATAPYHETAVGIHSDLGRRPSSENTRENINIAMFYSTYHVMRSLVPTPEAKAQLREMMQSVGLDPDDDSTDRTSPVGLGNLAGKAVVEKRKNDGMNQLGNEGGQKYFQQPYADYTGYRPVNTPEKIRNPSRWQPHVDTNGGGIFFAQKYVTPQMGQTTPYSYKDPKEFLVKKPRAHHRKNRKAYKKQTDEVLAASANLNDERKLKAEYFNDKLIFSAGLGIRTKDDLLEFIQEAASFHIAGFDVMIAAWYNKSVYDTQRPFTAVRYLYGDKKLTAWGGPGKGTVTDMPASQWKGYLQVPDHPEYPSGSTAFCASQAQVGRLLDGTDKTDIQYEVKKGGSYIEPGVTPAKDTVLRWTDWKDLVDDCAKSRVWAGVHFKAATEVSKDFGTRVGDHAYKFVRNHIEGKRGSSAFAP